MKIIQILLLMMISGFASQATATGDCSVGYAFMKNGQYEQAYSEFRKLAERGYPFYLNTIATMHQQGQGVPASNMMAHVWYSLSAAQADADGIKGKANLADKLSKEQLADSHYLSTEYAADYLEPYIISWSLN